MPLPKKFNRKTEPLRELLELVLDKKNYEKTGHVRIVLENYEQAQYTRVRLYQLFKIIRGEAKSTVVLFPCIQQKGTQLEFSFQDRGPSGGQRWRVVEEEENE